MAIANTSSAFDAGNCEAAAYAVSRILFPKNTKPGTYTMMFTGVSGSLTNSTSAKFTVK